MTRLFALAACAAVAFGAGCGPAPAPPVDTSADVAAINALSDREMTAFTTYDTAAFSSIFSADIFGMPPNEPALQGLDALVAWTNGLAEQYTLAGSYTSTDVVVSGDLAVQRFTATLSMTPKAGGDAMSEDVKGLHILRRQADGSWRIVQDVWNTNNPPPMAGGN